MNKKETQNDIKKNINQEIPEGAMKLDELDLEKVNGGVNGLLGFIKTKDIQEKLDQMN